MPHIPINCLFIDEQVPVLIKPVWLIHYNEWFQRHGRMHMARSAALRTHFLRLHLSIKNQVLQGWLVREKSVLQWFDIVAGGSLALGVVASEFAELVGWGEADADCWATDAAVATDLTLCVREEVGYVLFHGVELDGLDFEALENVLLFLLVQEINHLHHPLAEYNLQFFLIK